MNTNTVLKVAAGLALCLCTAFANASSITVKNTTVKTLNVEASYQYRVDFGDSNNDSSDWRDEFNLEISPNSDADVPFTVKNASALANLQISYLDSRSSSNVVPICIVELDNYDEATGIFKNVVSNANISLKHHCSYDAATGTIRVE